MSNDTCRAPEWYALVEYILPLVGRNDFKRETDLYHDLDLNLRQIEKLLNEWCVLFDVDMSGFDIGRYYPFSRLSMRRLLLAVLRVPFSRRTRETLGGWQLTLGMLEQAMIRGKWIDASSSCSLPSE